MIIGIDFDDTIAKSQELVLPLAIEYHKKVYKKEDKIDLSLEFPRCLGWTEDEVNQFFYNGFQQELLNIEPNEGVKEIIEKLREDGHKIIIVTARNDKQITDPTETTKKWLMKYDIKVDEIFVGINNKYEIVCSEKINVFIDDNFNNCKLVKEKNGIPVIMFATSTNDFLCEGIVRLDSWKEIYDYISNLDNIKC